MNRLVSLLMLLCLTSFVYAGGTGQGAAVRTLVIDPGHGGLDPGAIGPGGHHESELALAVSLKFGEMVKEAFPDVKIIYTRTTDKFVSLADRADMANKAKADLFICIHLNSATNHEAYGTATYVLGLHRTDDNLEIAKRENAVIDLEDNKDKKYEFDPNSPEGHIIMSMKQNAFLDQSILIASKIEDELAVLSKRKSRGVKQAGFWVLYKTAMPSLLAEIGFISNPTEEAYLSTESGQENIATSIYKAFRGYKYEIEGRKDTPILAKAPAAEKKKEVLTEPAPPVSKANPTSPGKQPPVQEPEAPKATSEQKPQRPSTASTNLPAPSQEEKAWVPDTASPVESAPAVYRETVAAANTYQSIDKLAVTVRDTEQIKMKTPAPEPMAKKIVPLRTGNEPPAVKKETKPAAPKEPLIAAIDTTVKKAAPASTAEAKANKPVAPKPKADTIKIITDKKEMVIIKTEEKAVVAKKEPVTTKGPKETAIPAKKEPVTAKAEPREPLAAPPKKEPVAAKQTSREKEKQAAAAPVAKENIIFTVQLIAAHRAPKNYEQLVDVFGLINREDVGDAGVVRYMAGQYKHYREAQKTLELAKSKGFTDAFIISYVNDERTDTRRTNELGLKYP